MTEYIGACVVVRVCLCVRVCVCVCVCVCVRAAIALQIPTVLSVLARDHHTRDVPVPTRDRTVCSWSDVLEVCSEKVQDSSSR